MSARAALVAQFRRPHGPFGRLAGLVMATRPSNRRRNTWTVELLMPLDGARVLELGCGPGLAVAAAMAANAGHVLALDHSPEMVGQAWRRNRQAIAAGRAEVRLGGVEALRPDDGPFDAAIMVNVAQFLPDRMAAFDMIGEGLAPGGRLAVTHMPRNQRATAADADDFAALIAAEMDAADYRDIRTERLPLEPVPAVAVIGTRG